MTMHASILIIAEHADGQVRPVTYELAAAASVLCREMVASDIEIVVIGEAVDDPAADIAVRTGMPVTAIQVPGLSAYNADTYKHVLAGLVSERKPSYVLTAHSTQGVDFLPGLAVRLGAACMTGVEAIVKEDSGLCFRRAVCGGKIMADIHSDSAMVMLTILPGAFAAVSAAVPIPGPVTLRSMDFVSQRCFPQGVQRKNTDISALAEADVIVAAGRGIGEKDNLMLIHRLAERFPRSAVAGSRIVCDSGWLDYAQQVGVTGSTVSPRLYIACGISGAVQHVSGMRGADFVVSINTDRHAAIFNVSDICVVEDLTTFIPLLLRDGDG